MTTTYTPTTELEGINTMITSVGLAPISDLEVTGKGHIALAKDIFHKVNREVQTEGWDWNSEEQYPLTTDGDDKVSVPGNALRIDGSKGYNPNCIIVSRGEFLYDKYNHQWTFDGTVYVDIVWFLPFTDLPEAARNYIVMRAARKFQTKLLGDANLHGFTQEDEAKARLLLENEEAEVGDYNMLTGSISTLSVLVRDRVLS